MVVITLKDKQFYLDSNLKKRLDNIKYIVRKKNFDCVFIVDGMERIGKSTLAITCGYYLSDGNLTSENVAVDSKDAVDKIERLPDKSVLVIDEGSLVFNSKDSMTKEQRKLIKIMNVVGQKNMVFIIVLPCFFDLNKQIAVRRSKFLLHCYTDPHLNRGRFGYFSDKKKKVLYALGKKNFDSYSRPKLTSFEIGRYTDFNPLGKDYIEKKRESLMSALHEEEKEDMKSKVLKNMIYHIEAYNFPFKMLQKDKAQMLGISDQLYCMMKKKGELEMPKILKIQD